MTDLFKILAALISVALPAIGSGYAMEKIGGLSERLLPKTKKGFFTNSLIFSVLAETPTIYGLVVAVMILTSVKNIDALTVFMASLCIAAPGIAAAYSIGLVARAALTALSKMPELFQKMIILAVLPEVIAIYGLIISLLILMSPAVSVLNAGIAALLMITMSPVALFIARVCTNAIRALIKDPNTFTQALVLAVLPESIALYLLLVAIFIIQSA